MTLIEDKVVAQAHQEDNTRRMNRLKISVLLFPLLVTPALSASSDWYATEGGSIRLVTAGTADSDGILKGALQIHLKPGWKTYWMDPGDAGVAPQIDVSASRYISGVQILFPAPKRFDDGYSKWAGYDEDLALALDFTTAGPSPLIEADVFIGICEEICIPVQAHLTVDPMDVTEPGDDNIVTGAHDRLPQPASAQFGVRQLRLTGNDTLHATAVVPEPGANPVLFMVSSEGWYFGTPKEVGRGGGEFEFEVPVLMRPHNGGATPYIPYTLVDGSKAASGDVRIEAGNAGQ